MARILNTDDLALAQNAFRNALREAEALRDMRPIPAEAETATRTLANALVSLVDAAFEADATLYLMARSDAVARCLGKIGYSPELAAAAFRASSMLEHDGYLSDNCCYDSVYMLSLSPEYRRARDERMAPVPACCDWTVPAID